TTSRTASTAPTVADKRNNVQATANQQNTTLAGRPDILNSQSALVQNQYNNILSALRQNEPSATSPNDQQPPTLSEKLLLSETKLPYLNLAMLNTGAKEKLTYKCQLCKVKKGITAVKVGMFGSADLNLITTPVYRLTEEQRASLGLGDLRYAYNYAGGYSGGLSYGLSFGKRWTVQTGLIYGSISYQSIPLGETYGEFDLTYLTEQFDEFRFDVVQIPLEAQFQFNRSSKWRFYGTAGTSFNSIIQTYYGTKVTPDPTTTQFSAVSTGQGGLIPTVREQESEVFTGEKFVDGIFEGGPVNRNLYMTINAGLGLEYAISHRWSFFMEPGLRYYLGTFSRFDLGPNEDFINSANLKAGAKVNLK
ncbi:MAG: outer membrane beta-barrel protein, partial [Bacteroidota bacterium]